MKMGSVRRHYGVIVWGRIRNSKAIFTYLPMSGQSVQRLDPPRVGSDDAPSAPRAGHGSPAITRGAMGSDRVDAPRPCWRLEHPAIPSRLHRDPGETLETGLASSDRSSNDFISLEQHFWRKGEPQGFRRL
jgi:hypothetical protein